MDLFLTADLGTSAAKIVILDESFNTVASVTQEYSYITPQFDYAEIDPETYYRAFRDGISRMATEKGVDLKAIKTISVCSQAETFVMLDSDKKPLMNAIVWIDNRATEEVNIIKNEFERREIFRKTGQQDIVPTWTACKLLWLKRNKKDLYKNIKHILFVEDYLIFKLTGEHFTDFSLQPSSLLFNIVDFTWWDDMLDFLNLNREQLPTAVESGKIVGEISAVASKELGLNPKVVVVSGAMDHMAGLIGSGNLEPGVTTETTGTVLAICTTVDRPIYDPEMRIPLYLHSLKGKYVLLPWSHTSGIILRWFRDKFFIDISLEKDVTRTFTYDKLTALAERINPGSDGLIMLPFFGGAGSPELDAKAKGVLFGMTLTHEKGHFIRAIMESIAYVLKSNIQALEEMGVSINEIRSLGGGAKSDLWCQIKADVLNKKVIKLDIEEVSPLGLAILSGLAVGKYENVHEAVKKHVKIYKTFIPDKNNSDIYRECYEKYVEIYQNLKDVF